MSQEKIFDKAAVVTASDEEAPCNPWRLCVVTQVEELKILVRMLPLWPCVDEHPVAGAAVRAGRRRRADIFLCR